MTEYTVHYFNARGRAELIRLIFKQAGKEFTDHRIPWPEEPDAWQEEKKNVQRYPFGTAPTLEVNGKVIPETTPIARYLAREFGLAGKNNCESAWCDIFVETLQELRMEAYNVIFSKETDQAVKDQMWKDLEAKVLKKFAVLEGFYKSNNDGKGFLVGDGVTWADLILLDYADVVSPCCPTFLDNTPLLKALNQRVRELPNIKAHLASRPVSSN